MATFRFISVDRRLHPALGGKPLLLLAVLWLGAASLLPAGSVITLTSGSEADGKVSLAATALHVDGNSATPDLNLPDVLEASFGDAPFALNCVYVTGNQLPPGWKTQDIGLDGSPGSATVSDGTIKLTCGGSAPRKKNEPKTESLFFVGQPWTGDGEWTARLKELDPAVKEASGGLMARESLDPEAAMSGLEPTTQSSIRLLFLSEDHKQGGLTQTPGDPPVWLRLTRSQKKFYYSVSTDGKDWNLVAQYSFKKGVDSPWVGLFANCHKEGVLGNIAIDQVSLTPPPSTARVLAPGVLLRSGTLLAGGFGRISFDPAASDTNGDFYRLDRKMSISRDLIAAIVLLPMERSHLADMGANAGILMRNGDVMAGASLNAVTEDEVSVSSVLLGLTPYKSSEVRACFLQPLQAQPGAFEVRLRDGSIINASAIAGDANEAVITDVCGLTIQAGQDEIAQIRAGTAQTQTLAQLDWKATPPPAAPTPAPSVAPATNAAPADSPPLDANGNPIVIPPPAPPPLVQNWMGPSQEQIMETGMQTAIEFPLPGKFRAMGVQVAVASESPPGSSTVIHILADGREIAKSPPFRAGDSPRFMELPIHDPSHLTLVAESASPGVKVLYIDPVAIRD
jgi:hypothetical protein